MNLVLAWSGTLLLHLNWLGYLFACCRVLCCYHLCSQIQYNLYCFLYLVTVLIIIWSLHLNFSLTMMSIGCWLLPTSAIIEILLPFLPPLDLDCSSPLELNDSALPPLKNKCCFCWWYFVVVGKHIYSSLQIALLMGVTCWSDGIPECGWSIISFIYSVHAVKWSTEDVLGTHVYVLVWGRSQQSHSLACR